MSKVFIEEDTLSSIGNAIREKTGKSSLIAPGDMPTEIGSIEGGEIVEVDSHEFEDGTLSRSIDYYYYRPTYYNDRITIVGSYAFSGSKYAEGITLPNVEEIGANGFYYSNSKGVLNVPKITQIIASSLYSSFFEEINAPLVESVNDYGCYSMSNLTTINFAPTSVGGSAFFNCNKLKEIDISKVETLDEGSEFQYCKSLQNLDLSSLTSIYMGMYTFDGCASLEELNFPELLQIYGCCNFANCSSLRKVDFSKLTSLGMRYTYSTYAVFYNCPLLEAIIIRTDQVCSLNNANMFYQTPIAQQTTGYIYVPKALIEDYKVATNWVYWADRFRAIEDYPEICGEVETE